MWFNASSAGNLYTIHIYILYIILTSYSSGKQESLNFSHSIVDWTRLSLRALLVQIYGRLEHSFRYEFASICNTFISSSMPFKYRIKRENSYFTDGLVKSNFIFYFFAKPSCSRVLCETVVKRKAQFTKCDQKVLWIETTYVYAENCVV